MEAATHLKEYSYTDPKGKKVKIPAKCVVSKVEGENTLEDGLVIIDMNGNEWVWIEVPRIAEVYPIVGINLNNITDEQCSMIYVDLANYASTYRQDGYEDIFYSNEQSGFKNADAYNETKNNMLRSIYINEGFWIGRYEVGIENNYRNYGSDYYTEHPITDVPVIKANAYPYNYVTCSQAQILSKQLSVGGKISSLMFGIQWDLTCKFLETKGLTQEEIKGGDGIGSTKWGNYKNSSIILTRGKYNTSPEITSSSKWLYIEQGTKNATMLLTTGASEDVNKMNIYDFAGNVHEWTLEYTNNIDSPCTYRGGCYGDDGSSNTSYIRGKYTNNDNRGYVGFRPSLY